MGSNPTPGTRVHTVDSSIEVALQRMKVVRNVLIPMRDGPGPEGEESEARDMPGYARRCFRRAALPY